MKLTSKVSVNCTCHLVLTEGEMRALDALAGYGTDEFIKVFYQRLGKVYLEPYEQDLRRLFESINELRGSLHAIDEFKKAGQAISDKYKL